MDASAFLSRVIAPGEYYAFAFKRLGSSTLGHRFLPQDNLPAAVRWLKQMADEADVWHAVASFREKRRLQANAENLKCFWYDADISRPGDNKKPDSVWQNIKELMGWLGSIKDRLPLPNVWVASGYGVHLYWVLDVAIPAAEWTTHAKVFRSMLASLGARGDISISADSARLLRPPETFNYKVPEAPAPVRDITPVRRVQFWTSDFVTKDFLALLTPEVTGLGAPPPGKRVSTKSLAAAKSNLSKPPPADFATIALRCPQVRKSLDEEGEFDEYPLWHLLTNLAYFCNDHMAAHALGRKHPKYSEDDTEAKLDKTASEHAAKQNFGAPSCESIDIARPGVCDNCEYRGKIKSPYTLGWASNIELPTGYRQDSTGLWHTVGEGEFEHLVNGTVSDEQLLYLGNGLHQLAFTYTLAGLSFPIQVNEDKISGTADKVRGVFVPQGVSLNRFNSVKFGEFVVAWITMLREAHKAVEAPPSFGWVHNKDGGYLGLSVAGTFYRVDGTEGIAQPGDPTIHKNYTPEGDIKLWRQATEYVIADKPELHTIVAAAFAAPLMELVGESGILSVWSRLSGARKTSAFRVGTAVWCNPITGMSAIKDTTNSVQQSLGETRIMPVFWDEVHTANKEQIATMVELFFNITQGRGRARLDQRMEQRTVGYWRTLLILSANRPNAEIIEQDRSHTNAGALRLFEYAVEPTGKADQEAVSIVQMVERNYGRAGREYARWIALNLDTVQSVIKTMRAMLYKDIPDIRPEERFHVATILGVVCGAWIASKATNLVSLDWQAVYAFLKGKLREIRAENQTENPSHDDGKSLSAVFERFVSDSTEDLLVTQSFAAVGRPGISSQMIKLVRQPPIRCVRALIHIGLDEGEMRFDHNAFKSWCFRNKLSHTAMFELMDRVWKVNKVRAVLAIGTEWSSGAKVYYYRLGLNTPELEHHLKWGTPAPMSATNVVPFPPAAQ